MPTPDPVRYDPHTATTAEADPADSRDPGGGPLSVGAVVHAAALQFDRAWDPERPTALAEFLPPPGPARTAAALELALIDIDRRREAGLSADPNAYLAAIHELAADPAAAAAIRAAAAGPGGPTPPPGYRLFGPIGCGGMGDVYRAHDARLDRPVAVKVLQGRYAPTSAAARRFVDEARITAGLQHPGIPPVHEVGALPDGRPFLAMKLIAGHTLAVQRGIR